MKGNTFYLLLQSTTTPESFDFKNPLMEFVANKLKNAPYFAIDNYSDSTTISYARQFIEKSEELVIICDEIKSDSLGSLLPILNQCVKRSQTKLLCIGESRFLGPFIKKMNGRVFETAQSLMIELQSRDF